MNMLNLTEEGIATLRGQQPEIQACPHWSAMRLFRRNGEFQILYRCDNPNPTNGTLGDIPRTNRCLVHPEFDIESARWSAETYPVVGVYIPERGLNYFPEVVAFWRLFLEQQWEVGNTWVDQIEDKEE